MNALKIAWQKIKNYFTMPWGARTNVIWFFINSFCVIFNILCASPFNYLVACLNIYAAFICGKDAWRQYYG